MSNELAPTTTNKLTVLKTTLDKPAVSQAISRVMKDRTPQFVSSLIQLVSGSRMLSDCDPNTVIAAAMTAASLDLPIDKNLGFAHIVPYKGVAQFQMGYKGFIQLALRTGQYQAMNARSINAEAFKGYDAMGEPIIDWSEVDESKPPVGYAFAFRLVSGFTKICYWPKIKVEAHAKRYSQAYRGNRETPWSTNFDAMALKTVIKNELAKWGILSIQMQKALVEDQGVKKNFDDEPHYPDQLQEPEQPKLLRRGKAKEAEPEETLTEPAPAEPADKEEDDIL